MRLLAKIGGFAGLMLALSASGCGHPHHDDRVAVPRRVTIEVEVYDPVTNAVWENVGVRVVDASVEWANCTCSNRFVDDFYPTDASGVVVFTADYLADAELGFPENTFGDAVLVPQFDGDEATVLLEIFAPGSPSVFAEARLTWDEPFDFISVPWEP